MSTLQDNIVQYKFLMHSPKNVQAMQTASDCLHQIVEEIGCGNHGKASRYEIADAVRLKMYSIAKEMPPVESIIHHLESFSDVELKID